MMFRDKTREDKIFIQGVVVGMILAYTLVIVLRT